MNGIIKSDKKATMSSREIATLTGKRHDHVMRDIRSMLEQLEKDVPSFGETYIDGMGRKQTQFRLDRLHVECLLTGYSIPLRMKVLERLTELEEERKSIVPALPDFTDPAAAAIAWAEQYQAAQLAIATKAEIGSRREATAMATASTQARRAKRLEIELDRSQEWSTIKRMEMITGLKFKWKLLSDASKELGHERKYVYDANYGKVRTYHVDAWQEAYALDINH